MFLNYLKIGIRNILKYKFFSFINAFGLAAAMSVCMLIILMLVDQKRYDQFHAKKDRTYRILSEARSLSVPNATTPFPLASSIKAEYPIIEESTHLVRGVGGDAIYNGNKFEMRGFFADSSFFNVFSYELAKGNKDNALASPNSMVISNELARQIFKEEDPIGKTVEFADRGLHHLKKDGDSNPVNWGSYIITGVIADKTYKSHLKFDVLFSSASLSLLYKEQKIRDLTSNWEDYYQCYTYVVLAAGKNQNDLIASLDDLVKHKYANFDLEQLKEFKLTGQKLTHITPGILVGLPTTYSLPVQAYYFLASLALIIMISACLNYTNLSTARSLTRAKEIGVRKVTGASKKALIYQFLSESIIMALLALVMALIMLLFVKPAFMSLWINQYLNFDFQDNVVVYIIFIVFAIVIGIIAGVHPALHLSKYQPVKALKNNENPRPGKFGMRKVLSIMQFVISLFFITTSIVIFNQFKHFLQFHYEFNPKRIVNIELQRNDYHLITSQLGSVPGVSRITSSDFIPATGGSGGIGLRKEASQDEFKNFTLLRTDHNFLETFELKLVEGRNFPATGESSDRFILVNEAAIKALGYKHPSEVVGKVVELEGDSSPLEIIGVVQDFHFRMLMEEGKIGPLVLRNQPDKFVYVSAKITSALPMDAIAKLEQKWKSIDEVHPFKYKFYEDQLEDSNQGFVDVVSIFSYITFLAITIACLGLLGMATYTSERRMKEVSIRKVLGAEDFTIALLLSKEFLIILITSVFIAAPVSYIVNNLWLQNFPNRVDFGVGTIFIGILILLSLGLLTIGSQTIKASKRKAVDSLRIT
jgi:putative ABC transport system permease protein